MGVEWRSVDDVGEPSHSSLPETVSVAACFNSILLYSQTYPRLETKSYGHPIEESCPRNIPWSLTYLLGERVYCGALGGPEQRVQA